MHTDVSGCVRAWYRGSGEALLSCIGEEVSAFKLACDWYCLSWEGDCLQLLGVGISLLASSSLIFVDHGIVKDIHHVGYW